MARPLTVAVTGPTGTFGFGLMPLLEADDRIGRIIGIARRPFDPAEHGWSKMEYRQGDVRDEAALADAFDGVDVVVHLAFLIASNAPPETIHEINVDGTLNVFRAAAAAGVERFVYASSVAAYGFHADNPIGMTEKWTVPTLPVQFIHEDDVGQAFLLCVVAAGPPGAYNITGDGVMTGADVARELGIAAIPIPGAITRTAARLATALPLPKQLGWRPRYSSAEALRDTIRGQSS